MRLAALALLLCAACTAWRRSEPAPAAPALALAHVNVVDVERGRVLPDQTILVAGSRIVAVGPSARVRPTAGAAVVDGRGKYVIPGLWDMHVHPWAPSTLSLLAANGVTGARGANGTPDQLRWRDEIRRGERVGPLLYLAGPVIDSALASDATSSASGERAVRVRGPEDAAEQVRAQKLAGYDFIKVRNALSPTLYQAIVAAAREQGMPVAGHVPPAVRLATALQARQASIEHLTGYLQALVPADAPQQPGADFRSRILAWRFADSSGVRALAEATRAAGVWNAPTLAVRILDAPQAEMERYLARREAAYLRPEVREQFRDRTKLPGYERFTAEDYRLAVMGHAPQDALLRALRDAGAGLLAGSDVGPWGFSLHWELEALVNAGLTPAEALAAATVAPARFLAATDSLGSIGPGKRADLVLLDANPLEDVRSTQRIRAVVLGGRHLDRPALDDLLAGATDAGARQTHAPAARRPRW